MPIYEYKCPNGHLFEVFHGMSEPSPDRCEVCGAEPLERVLHPVAVHYKGSGFYSTDYGKGGRKPKDGEHRRLVLARPTAARPRRTAARRRARPATPSGTKKTSDTGGGSSSGGSSSSE